MGCIPPTVDIDEILEWEKEVDEDAYEDRLLWLPENLCRGDLGLPDSTGDVLSETSRTGCVDLVSCVSGSAYPLPSHGVLLRLGPFASHVLWVVFS